MAELAETARRTGRLTQQLLSMEKARGRDASDNWQTANIGALSEELAKRFAERELRRNVSVSFKMSGDERPISCDPVMLSEAIENLLDNASRYGCPDGGDVGLDLEFTDNDVVIRVEDSGQGIPEDVRDRVFDRFFRGSDDASGGCGLGLAIVRKVAEAHGGSAHVAERTNGAAVEIRIPVDGERN